MFAGIGGFREGLRRAGGFECVGHCEQDEHAERSYRALFDTRGEWFCEDIRKADAGSMPDFELLCGGFPCQSFSIAGSRHGFADPRGTLFFELARVAETRKPQYLLFENVPGLLNHDGGRTFAAILDTLDGLGYGVEWQCSTAKISMCPSQDAGCTLWDILTPDAPEKYYLSEKQMMQLLPRCGTERRAAGCTTPQA